MKRDGARPSLWQTTANQYSTKPASFSQLTYDVVIVGGGITGITTALLLQNAGKKCLVAEAHTLCFGTTGGTTAHINSFFDTTYDQVASDFGKEAATLAAKAARESLQLFEEHIKTYKIDCDFEWRDGYVYAQDEKQEEELDTMFDAAKEAGAAIEYAQEIPVPASFSKAVVFQQQAQLHPVRYVQALAAAFEAAGGVILQQCPVNKFTEENDVLLIETANGTLKAKHLIWATHTPPGINILHFRLAPYRSYALAVKLKNGAYPEALAYDMYDPYHYYRTQSIDGENFLIVGGEDHKTAHEENTEACFEKLVAHAHELFEVESVTHQWSSQYFEPADGLAYIGHLPGNPDNVFVATGFGGNGITYSHIAARILTDLITKGKSEYKDLYSPGRIKPIAGFAAFVQENADVVAQFIGKRIGVEKLEALSELPKGEAKVIKYDGEMVAIYKNEEGKVFALNPVCTHAKCIVAWNTAEKTWDCPCHGARYDVSGEVLTGPARKALEKIDLG